MTAKISCWLCHEGCVEARLFHSRQKRIKRLSQARQLCVYLPIAQVGCDTCGHGSVNEIFESVIVGAQGRLDMSTRQSFLYPPLVRTNLSGFVQL